MSIEKAYFNAAADGKLSIGNQIINLKDESKKTFQTDNFLAFETFAKGREGESEIYYSASEVTLVPTKAEKNFKALAVCKMASSPPLALLAAHQGRELNILQFEKLLTTLRKYAVGSHMVVLSNLRAFSVAKKQTYERDVDNAGNFRLLIQKEAAGTGNWVPPEKMAFSVPLFTFLEDKIEIEFDLIFSVADSGQPVFTLENLTFDEEVLDARVKVLDTRLSAVTTCPKYWGTYVLAPMDDSWKYRENKASL